MRKVSRRLIPFLFVLQVASYLDRINVGLAQLQMKSAIGFTIQRHCLRTRDGHLLHRAPRTLCLKFHVRRLT